MRALSPVPNGTWPRPLTPLAPFAPFAVVVDGTDQGLPDEPLNLFLQDKVGRLWWWRFSRCHNLYGLFVCPCCVVLLWRLVCARRRLRIRKGVAHTLLVVADWSVCVRPEA